MIKMLPFTFLFALASSGCTIQPPDDGTNLGTEVSAAAVTQAMVDASSGVSDAQAFHVGDDGIVQTVDRVFSSSSLRESHELKVTRITSTDIIYTDLNKNKGLQNTYDIPLNTSTSKLELKKPAGEKSF